MISSARLQAEPRWHFWGQSTHVLPRFLAACLLSITIAWLASGLWQTKQKSERIVAQQQTIARLDQSISTKVTRTSAVPASTASGQSSTTSTNTLSSSLDGSPEQRRQINSVIRQLNTPWDQLFDQLESSTPRDVSLISIEPDAKRGSVRLQAEARALDTLLTYAARLQNQGVLGSLTYSKHETNEQDPNKPIRLSVEYSLLAALKAPGTLSATGGKK
jgi:Tfp pilus assembly protein PilN